MPRMIEIRDVTDDRKGRAQFIALPYQLHQHNPIWRAMPQLERRHFLKQTMAKLGADAMVLFMALDDGRPVGRISAHLHQEHLERHDPARGFFGFFECIDDPAVCGALLKAAESWLLSKGMKRAAGPFSATVNDEFGVLVDGFGLPPAVMMPHTPPYYPALLAAHGYEVLKRVHMYGLSRDEQAAAAARLAPLSKRVRRTLGDRLTVRPFVMKQMDREIEIVARIYNAAWADNWFFASLPAEELAEMVGSLKPLLHPRMGALAELDGELVGILATIPDIYDALAHVRHGRLFPTGWLSILFGLRRIRHARTIVMGVLPEARRHGIEVLLYESILTAGEALPEYEGLTMGWILESNHEMLAALERLGASVTSTHAVFGKELCS